MIVRYFPFDKNLGASQRCLSSTLLRTTEQFEYIEMTAYYRDKTYASVWFVPNTIPNRG
jgi:hypothetical protein